MNIQQVLFHLSIQNEERREEVIQWLRLHRPKTFAQQARLGKVAPAIIATSEKWHIDMSELAPLKQFVLESGNQRLFYDLELQDLQESGDVPPQSILILKGRAIQRWYPSNLPPRQSADIDFVIEDEEQFWQVGQWLIKRGYELPMMGAAYPNRVEQRNWHFILSYSKRLPNAISETITGLSIVEMLQGVTSISSRHFFDLRPIIARARDARKEPSLAEEHINPFFLYPTREDCLLSVLVEISERKLEIRDAVDFYMLISIGGKNDALDWNRLSQIIEEESLIIQFLRLASYYTLISETSLPPEIERTYQQWQRQYIYWKYIARRPELNLIAFYYTRHFRWTYAFKEVFLNFWETVLDSPPLERLLFLRHSKALPYKDLDCQQTLAQLLYLTSDHGTSRGWGKGKGGEAFLRTPIGIFLATRTIHFTQSFLDNLHGQFPEEWNIPFEESQIVE